MNQFDEVCQQIINLGGTEYPYPNRWEFPGVRSFFMPRFEGVPDCECNDRPPNLRLNVYPATRMGDFTTKPTTTFEVGGEANGVWLAAQIYSIDIGETVAFLPKAEIAGKAVWSAFVAAMK